MTPELGEEQAVSEIYFSGLRLLVSSRWRQFMMAYRGLLRPQVGPEVTPAACLCYLVVLTEDATDGYLGCLYNSG